MMATNPHDDSVDSLEATPEPALLSTKVFLDRRHSLEVVVQEYAVDWDFLGESTLVRVQEVIRAELPGVYYFNPWYTVSCTALCPEFVKRMNQYLVAWCKRMNRVLGSSMRRTAWKRAGRYERRLAFSGLLISPKEGRVLDLRQILNCSCHHKPANSPSTINPVPFERSGQ